MTNYNWAQFTKRITIHAPADAIFKAWAKQEGLESWFLRLAEFKAPSGKIKERNDLVQKGDQYRWRWFGYDDTIAEEGEVIFSNDKDELQFTFTGGCIVKVSVKEEAGEMVCELQQAMPMDDQNEQRYFFIECGKDGRFT